MDAAEWDARYASSDLIWSAGPNEFVAAELADLSPGSAVDLAAGEGRNALWLADLGWHVHAVDFSQSGLDKGRRLAEDHDLSGSGGSVAWHCADARRWTPEEPVDLVVVAYLQLAAPARGESLRHALTMLRRGGVLLVVAHDSTNLTWGYGGPPDPTVLYTAEDVLADLGSAGVAHDVARAERVPRTVTAGDGSHTAYDCLVRVTRG